MESIENFKTHRRVLLNMYKYCVLWKSLGRSWSFGISSDLENHPVQTLTVYSSRFMPSIEIGSCTLPSFCKYLRMIQLPPRFDYVYDFHMQISQCKGRSTSRWIDLYVKSLQIRWPQEKWLAVEEICFPLRSLLRLF